jgi:cytoskeletal protein CcmA (bactofilin family)
MRNRSLFYALVFGGALLALAAPQAALAAEVRNGAAAVVAPGETIDDDLFAAGQTVTIAGTVTGDVFATGQTVVVTGMIGGDLIAAAQQVVIDGVVNGDVRAGGAVVTVNGSVGHNVTSLAQQVNVSTSGRVDGSVVAAGETISAFGPVGRGITAGGSTLQIGGPVGGDVLAWAQTLSFGPNARITGDLDYHSERQATVPGGAVSGQVQFQPVEREPQQTPVLNGLLDFGGLIWLFGSAIVGGVAIVLAPRASARAIEMGHQQPLATFAWGLLALCVVPLGIVLIGVTLVGIPLAIVLAALYALGLMLAWPALGLLVGSELARRLRRGEPLPVLAALAVGLILLHLLTHVPFLGGLVAFLGLILGVGMVVQSIRRWRRASEVSFA